MNSCSDEDEGMSTSASDLEGRSFTCDESYVNDDDMLVECYKTITFTSSTQCSIRNRGYDWIWDDGYVQDSYNETKTCSYSVSGDKITLHDYPYYAFGGDVVLTYHGDYLEGDYVWLED